MKLISIRRDQLVAACLTSPEKDARYYLNGVFVEATTYETRLTTTDGTVMSTQRFDATGRNQISGCDNLAGVIVPIGVCKNIKPSKKPHESHVGIEQVENDWFLVDGAARYAFQPVDGKFPDYRRVIPSGELSKTPAHFDPLQIAKFARAAKALGCTAHGSPVVRIVPNGTSCALVSVGKDAEYIGIISPLRDTSFPRAVEAWGRDSLPTAK